LLVFSFDCECSWVSLLLRNIFSIAGPVFSPRVLCQLTPRPFLCIKYIKRRTQCKLKRPVDNGSASHTVQHLYGLYSQGCSLIWPIVCRLLLPQALLANYKDTFLLLVTFQVFTVVVIKVKVTLRPTVSRPVRLGVRRPSGTRDQFFFLLEIFFRQFRVCYFVTPSLT
jgi:hypothetical protein